MSRRLISLIVTLVLLSCGPGSVVDSTGNSTPIASMGGPYRGVEGTAITFDASRSKDPRGDTLTYGWDFGDGTSGTGRSVSHTYRNNGQYRASLVVHDSRGGSDSAQATVDVANAPPVITALTVPTTRLLLGTAATIQVAYSDPGVDDSLSARVAWGDQQVTTITNGSASHIYASAGNYYITVTVTDNDGAAATRTAAGAVDIGTNRAPIAHINGGATGTQEGATVSYDARGSSDPDGDSLTYRWQFGDGSAEVQGFAAQHRYIDQGKFSITLIVTDSHGATDQAHWAIEIWNVAPSVTPSLTVPPMPAPLPLQAKISPHAFDVGPADNPVATIDWGDGTVSKDTVHTYTKPGAYVVQVTATDKDGATSQPWMSGALWVYDASASHPTAPGYESIDLGTLGGDAFPRALNNRGEVVGSGAASSTQGWVHHGFFWKDGVLTDLGPSGSSRGHADAINEAGWIAGGSGQGDPNMALWNEGVPAGSNYVGAGEYGVWVVKLTEAKDAVANVEGHEYPRAYLVRNGSSTDLGNLGAYFAYGRDMNSLWQVVGEAAVKYVGAEAYEWHAFLWENGVMKDLGSLGTTPCPYNPQDLCSYSEALDINERGQIVGDAENSSGVMRAVVWDPNTTTPRDLGFGSGSSRAVKINERGQIAGDGSGEGYFLDGVELIRLGSLGGGKTSVAGMNESGMVIGTSATSAGEIHAFIWSRGSGMRDLGTGPFGAARVGSTAVAINERGDVVGVAAPCLYQYDFSCSVWSPARPILWRNHN